MELAVKADMPGLDTTKLCFYSYDKKANTYKRIEKPAYWIDKNWCLHSLTEWIGSVREQQPKTKNNELDSQ